MRSRQRGSLRMFVISILLLVVATNCSLSSISDSGTKKTPSKDKSFSFYLWKTLLRPVDAVKGWHALGIKGFLEIASIGPKLIRFQFAKYSRTCQRRFTGTNSSFAGNARQLVCVGSQAVSSTWTYRKITNVTMVFSSGSWNNTSRGVQQALNFTNFLSRSSWLLKSRVAQRMINITSQSAQQTLNVSRALVLSSLNLTSRFADNAIDYTSQRAHQALKHTKALAQSSWNFTGHAALSALSKTAQLGQSARKEFNRLGLGAIVGVLPQRFWNRLDQVKQHSMNATHAFAKTSWEQTRRAILVTHRVASRKATRAIDETCNGTKELARIASMKWEKVWSYVKREGPHVLERANAAARDILSMLSRTVSRAFVSLKQLLMDGAVPSSKAMAQNLSHMASWIMSQSSTLVKKAIIHGVVVPTHKCYAFWTAVSAKLLRPCISFVGQPWSAHAKLFSFYSRIFRSVAREAGAAFAGKTEDVKQETAAPRTPVVSWWVPPEAQGEAADEPQDEGTTSRIELEKYKAHWQENEDNDEIGGDDDEI